MYDFDINDLKQAGAIIAQTATKSVLAQLSPSHDDVLGKVVYPKLNTGSASVVKPGQKKPVNGSIEEIELETQKITKIDVFNHESLATWNDLIDKLEKAQEGAINRKLDEISVAAIEAGATNVAQAASVAAAYTALLRAAKKQNFTPNLILVPEDFAATLIEFGMQSLIPTQGLYSLSETPQARLFGTPIVAVPGATKMTALSQENLQHNYVSGMSWVKVAEEGVVEDESGTQINLLQTNRKAVLTEIQAIVGNKGSAVSTPVDFTAPEPTPGD